MTSKQKTVERLWWPWLLITLIPGLLNLWIAFQDLEEECKHLPFFQPYRIPGVWLWAIVQVSLPSGSFWFMGSLLPATKRSKLRSIGTRSPQP